MDAIGKYKIIKKLGSGGFGAVYLAEDPKLGEQVAIKVFSVRDQTLAAQITSATSDAGEVLRQRFLNEAKTLRKLSSNPHIVDLYDFDELDAQRPYYVMPYLPHSLRDELGSDATDAAVVAELDADEKPRRLPIATALLYLQQLLSALKEVHKAGLVHRDIKPANVLLDAQNQVKLCDFGIAKVPDSDVSHSGVGMGSRNYMAPEQRQSAKHVDARSDLYSVGVLAYRMLTGTLPEGRFADPNHYQPALSSELNEWVLNALEQQKERRPADAGEMLTALRTAMETQREQTASEETCTWVEQGQPQLKPELKPLQDKIIQAFKQNGEVSDKDMPVLRALADVGNVDEDALKLLITDTAHQLAAESQQQKTFQQWVAALRARKANNAMLSEEERLALIEAGAETTGRDKAELAAIINNMALSAKSAKPSGANSSANKQADNKVSYNQYQEESKGFPWVITLLVIIALAGGYWFYNNMQAREADELAKKEAQRQQAASQVAFYVDTSPSDARVRILNIQPTYKYGIKLKPGSYQVEVSKAGYHTTSQWFNLTDNRNRLSVALTEKPKKPRLSASMQKIVNSMVDIPSGSFMMGCSSGDSGCASDEKPRHRVNIKAFKLMATEVTWAMYQPCIDAGVCPSNAKEGADEGWGKGNRPMINVSYNDIVQHYIPWLNKQTGQTFRLPTEAEWEYAVRSGSNTKYSWGNSIDCGKARYGNYSDECGKQKNTDPVKSFSPNAYGLYDMHGNVWEWTADCWNDNYQGAPTDGSAWTSGNCGRRVLRGGSWGSSPRILRASYRVRNDVTSRSDYNGFRLAQDSRP